MYGTIAKLKTSPGALQAIEAMKEFKKPGFISSRVYQADSDPNELWLVVAFKDKQTYVENAEDPIMDQYFQALAKHLTAEPEWHDGEIILDSDQ